MDVIALLFGEQPGHLTADEVCARYDIGRQTLRNWILAGRFPEAHAVRAEARQLLWDATKLPDPETIDRPKRGGARSVRGEYQRPAKPYRAPEAARG